MEINKGGRPGLQYEIVRDICNQLETDGIKPSHSKVVAHLEGNPSKRTVLDHIERWRSEKRDATTIPGLSEGLLDSLRAEIALHVKKERGALEAEIKDLKEAKGEALDALEIMEKSFAELEDRYEALQEKLAIQLAEHEKITAGFESMLNTLEKQIKDLQQERDQLIKAGEVARTDSAKAQMQLDRADRAAEAAEARSRILEEDLQVLQKEASQAERDKAVSEEKALRLADRVDDFEAQKEDLEARLAKVEEEGKRLRTNLEVTQGEKAEAQGELKVAHAKLEALKEKNEALERNMTNAFNS